MPDLVRQLADALRATRRGRADLAELRAMSDEQLADIGLRREQLALLGRGTRKRHQGMNGQRHWPEPGHWPELAPCG